MKEINSVEFLLEKGDVVKIKGLPCTIQSEVTANMASISTMMSSLKEEMEDNSEKIDMISLSSAMVDQADRMFDFLTKVGYDLEEARSYVINNILKFTEDEINQLNETSK